MSRSRDRADASQADHASPPLEGRLAGYRLIRRIASGDRADVYLAVADAGNPADGVPPASASTPARDLADADGAPRPQLPLVVVRISGAEVSDATVTAEIEAMSTDATGTLPALYDVANLADGTCCLAVERIGGPSVSRLLMERSLSPGEAVTILAPIVAALAELARRGFVHARLATSDILLDDGGRPRLIGLGALRRLPAPAGAPERIALLRAGHVALADLVEDVVAAVRPAGALDGVVDFIRARLDARPFLPCEAELERRLFAAAVPAPIGGLTSRPRSARLPARIAAPHPPVDAPTVGQTDHERITKTSSGGFLRQLLALAQTPSTATEGLAEVADADHLGRARRRLSGLLRGKGRTATFGALVGGGLLVVMLTLVPPATADGGPSAVSPSDPAEPSAAAVEAPGDHPAEARRDSDEAMDPASDVASRDDVVAAARWLLERREECFATLDLACLDAVVQPGSALEAADQEAMQSARAGASVPVTAMDPTAIEVTGEMGAAVLLRVAYTTPEREPASLLVVRGEAGWRLREIFD